MDPDVEQSLAAALRRTFFQDRPSGYPANEAEKKDFEDHLRGRYQDCEDIVLPWVESKTDLGGSRILEIGCGTGSSTASFAGRAQSVHGYDINHRSVSAANERLRIMGIDNAECWAEKPSTLLERIERDHAEGVDVALLYAVMEHQTLDERLATLETCWRLLRPGGHLVVTDSPNRLCYKHFHTSEVPFLDMLPLRLVWPQLSRSPRAGFREGMKAALERSEEYAEEVLARWGTGISYHEFEAVIGSLEGLVVGDGFDPVLAERKPLLIEEELLLSYLVLTDQPVPLGFSRVSVDIILRKPGGEPVEPFRSLAENHVQRILDRFGRLPTQATSSIPAERGQTMGDEGLAASGGRERAREQGFETAPESAAVGPEQPAAEVLLGFDWACRVAEESLNGRTLARLAIAKFARKLTGRARR